MLSKVCQICGFLSQLVIQRLYSSGPFNCMVPKYRVRCVYEGAISLLMCNDAAVGDRLSRARQSSIILLPLVVHCARQLNLKWIASYIPKSARICFFFYSKCHKIMYEAMHSCFTARKCHLLNPMLEFTYKNPTIHSNPFPHLENIQSSGASAPMLQFQLAMFCSSVCI